MRYRQSSIFLGAAILITLPAGQAWAHWCNDLWASSYNLTVRPDSDTSPKEVYVQNNMGYQLPNFKLTATASSGTVTLTAPTNLKVAGTLLPGEKGTWKISGGSPAKIEDITFSVSFGNSGQSGMYPTSGAKAVMIVKTDGSLSPAAPPPGLTYASSGGNAQARAVEFQAVADWDDVATGLDKLLNLYCAGRASWGSGDGVTQTYCKDSASTTCPTTKPTASPGAVSDYEHLWAAGELAIRKASLGARLAVFRERLKCGVNDGDVGFAGYALFVLGYLGDDAGAKTFLQTQTSTSGDLGTIAKAALYMMGDTTQKADVQAGAKSSSVFVKVACAGALGIVDKDDSTVTSVLIPEVKWNEPDLSGEDGKGMFAAHVLEIVAFDRRGWVAKGVANGAVTFYGETGGGSTGGASGTGGAVGSGGTTGSGGASGAGGASGNRDASPSDGRAAVGGATGVGGSTGTTGTPGNGGTTGGSTASGSTAKGGATGSGGAGPGAGGATGVGGAGPGGAGAGGVTGSGGSMADGGSRGSVGGSPSGEGGSAGSGSKPQGTGGSTTGSTSSASSGDTSGCKCSLGGPAHASTLHLVTLMGLAWAVVRRRRVKSVIAVRQGGIDNSVHGPDHRGPRHRDNVGARKEGRMQR